MTKVTPHALFLLVSLGVLACTSKKRPPEDQSTPEPERPHRQIDDNEGSPPTAQREFGG